MIWESRIRQEEEEVPVKLNIFEGSRRVAALVGVLWVVGVGWSFNPLKEDYALLSLSVATLNATPVLSQEGCGIEDATEHILSNKLGEISFEICFNASKSERGTMMVPYGLTSDGGILMGDSFSKEVRQYTANVAKNYSPSAQLIEQLAEKRKQAQRDKIWLSAQFLFGGLLFGWIFVWAAGWIVRGFLGIPKGQDQRP